MLLKNRLKRQELFILRGRKDVIVEYEENGKIYHKGLGRLKHSLGKPCCYRGCRCQGREEIKVGRGIARSNSLDKKRKLIIFVINFTKSRN